MVNGGIPVDTYAVQPAQYNYGKIVQASAVREWFAHMHVYVR